MPEPNNHSDFNDSPHDNSGQSDHLSAQLGDQLLSAYVDGELQGEELAQVEQRLTADPAAQQLVEDLRALSGELQSLPSAAVGESLRSSVMQRAERAMLLGNTDPATLSDRETGSSRRWAWAAMAIAATLLLSIYLPDTSTKEPVLASAEPQSDKNAVNENVPDNKSASEMRIEAIEATEPATNELADLAKQESDSTSADESVAVASGQQATLQEPQESGMKRAKGTGVPLAVQSRVVVATDSAQQQTSFEGFKLACEVHITMGEGKKSIAQFDRVLVRAGIASVADKSATMQNEREQSDSAESEFVLVEAPVEQIAATLAACNIDTLNCPSIRIVDESSQSPPIVARLRQWERDQGETPAKPLPGEMQTQSTGQQARSTSSQRGRAVRINQGELNKAKLKQADLAARTMRQGIGPQKMEIAAGSSDNLPVRVLFVLQSAADLRKPIEINTEEESPVE